MSPNQILDLLEGAKIVSSNDSIEATTISIPEEASLGSIVFVGQDKFLIPLIDKSLFNDVVVIATSKFYEKKSEELSRFKTLIVINDLGIAMNRLSKYFYDKILGEYNFQLDGRQSGSAQIDPDTDIAQNVFIGENSKISQGCKLHPGVVIMANVELGEGTEVFPNVTIYPLSKIGKNCRIHSGTIIGADGFGYNFSGGEHLKVWHFSGVEIHDNVEIGSNTSVDMGAFTPTVIGSGTKIDNFCQVSHNSKIGKNCIFCGRSGVSGSCTVDDFVIFGAGAGAAPGVHLKTGTQVGACSIISENAVWGPNITLAGHPARPLKDYLRTQAKLNLMAKK